MKKSKIVLLSCIIAVIFLAVAVLVPAVLREKEKNRIKAQQELEQAAIDSYPKLDEIDVDSIVKLETYEGDIIYSVTDKDAIAEIMGILKESAPVPKYVSPEDDKYRYEGAPKDALWLDIYTEDDSKDWFIYVDDNKLPADFIIERTDWKNRTTGWFETTTGYYTKPEKIYSQIKAIMYKGERIDLNEAYNPEYDEPEKTGFEYNPDAIYTAENLTITDKEGWYTTDILMTEDKIFFTRIKENPKLHPEDFGYEFVGKYECMWGYMDRDGGNPVEFYFDRPGFGIYQLLTVTKDRVYAMTFDAGEGEDFRDMDYVVTAFDMSGNVIAEQKYKYVLNYCDRLQAFVTTNGKLAIFNGSLVLYDEKLNKIALNTDHNLIMVAPAKDGNIVALKDNEECIRRVVLNSADLKEISEDEETYPGFYDCDLLGMQDESTLVLVKRVRGEEHSKLISFDLETGEEKDLIDTFHSGIDDYVISCVLSIEPTDILCKTGSVIWYGDQVGITRYIKTDREKAAKRKQIKVCGDLSNIRNFNACSTDYYADECNEEDGNSFYWIDSSTDLQNVCRQNGSPDVICISQAFPDMIKTTETADLSTMLKNDDDLSEEDFFPGLIEAFTYEGALRAIPVSTYICSFVAPSGLLKGENLTAEEFSELLADNVDKKLFYDTRRFIIEGFISAYGNPFYRPGEGVCNFESEDFKNLIKVISNLDWEHYDEYEYANYDPEKIIAEWQKKMKASGAKLYIVGNAVPFYEVKDIETLYGKNYDFVGFPSVNGTRCCFDRPEVYVVNNNSEDKEGALEYIKFVLNNDKSYMYPTRIQTYDEYADYIINSEEYTKKSERTSKQLYAEKLKEALMSASGCTYSLPEGGGDDAYSYIEGLLERYYKEIIDEDQVAKTIQEYFQKYGSKH